MNSIWLLLLLSLGILLHFAIISLLPEAIVCYVLRWPFDRYSVGDISNSVTAVTCVCLFPTLIVVDIPRGCPIHWELLSCYCAESDFFVMNHVRFCKLLYVFIAVAPVYIKFHRVITSQTGKYYALEPRETKRDRMNVHNPATKMV